MGNRLERRSRWTTFAVDDVWKDETASSKREVEVCV